MSLAEVSEAELAKGGGIRLVAASSVVEKQYPVFIETLSDDDVKKVLTRIKSNERSNVLFAPKVTLFNRQTATIQDTTSRPFVVGLTPNGDKVTPQIHAVNNGTQLVVRTTARDDNSVRLDLRARFSDIRNVKVRSAGPPNTRVQVPEVSATDVQLSASIAAGESLAIWGMQHEVTARVTKSSFENVPYVSRMFKNEAVGTDVENIMLLLRPVIVSSEEADAN